jgi:uncharacterized membrane protein
MAQGGRDGLLVSGVAIGVGLVGTLDEVVLHQLLDWHHFVELTVLSGAPLDERARMVGLVSDGIFHVVSTALLAWGLWRLAQRGLPRAREQRQRLLAGVLIGFGGFNLYDATIQHKLLRLHEVRRGVTDLLPYDLAFGGLALVVLVAGVLLLRRVRPGSAPLRSP